MLAWIKRVVLTLVVVVGIVFLLKYLFFIIFPTGFEELRRIIFTLMLSGAIGGLIRNLVDNKGDFVLCNYVQQGYKISLGSIADLFTGAGAALAIFLFLIGVVKMDHDFIEVPLRIFVIGIVAGFTGKSIMMRASEELIRRVGKLEQETADIEYRNFIVQGNYKAFVERSYAEAEKLYDDAIRLRPDFPEGYVGKAIVARHLRTSDEAISLCTQAIQKKTNYALAWYNRACYKQKQHRPLSEVLADLRKAIELEPTLRKEADDDPDFEEIHQAPEFLALGVP